MRTNIEETGNKFIVNFIGDLDSAAAQETEKAIQSLMDVKNKEIILDCKELNYISSSGLRLFLGLLKNCKPNGNTLLLENVNDNIKKVFSMTGFSALFNMK
ncbi:MAG: STAS domain-containing protein [Muribaculaceae bacterium]|nr:STAS domain-containing protein [Muribaculaceae bacterium]